MSTKRYWYVGVSRFSHTYRLILTYHKKPTTETHGAMFGAVIGPFRTKRGAQFMELNGWNNPHCQTVADAERLAKVMT